MNDMQRRIINNYYSYCGKKTLEEMAKETGIQRTRLFRVLNGMDMKVSEYEIFRKCICNKIDNYSEVLEVVHNIEHYLDFADIMEIGYKILRKKKMDELIEARPCRLVNTEVV